MNRTIKEATVKSTIQSLLLSRFFVPAPVLRRHLDAGFGRRLLTSPEGSRATHSSGLTPYMSSHMQTMWTIRTSED